MPWLGSRIVLDQVRLAYLGIYFVSAAAIFLLSYRRAPSGVLRQQLKWITGGTLAAILPFFAFYIVPYFLGRCAAAVDESFGALAGADSALLTATPSFAIA